MAFPFQLEAVDRATAARAGRMTTAHGDVLTPAFMPVGTAGTVKTLSPDDLTSAGADILLSNTYHLWLRPGVETVRSMGGLHRFMAWKGAILTDSGGFQVMSLALLRTITDHGVEFRSHLDGAKYLLTPEEAIRMFDEYGVDGVMIGRGAIADPWIFWRAKVYRDTGRVPEIDPGERIGTALEHLDLSVEYKGRSRGVIEFRKHWKGYLRDLPNGAEVRSDVMRLTERGPVIERLLTYAVELGVEPAVTAVATLGAAA